MKLIEIEDKTVVPHMKWLINPKQICCIHMERVVVKDTEYIHYIVKLSNGSKFVVSEDDYIKLVK